MRRRRPTQGGGWCYLTRFIITQKTPPGHLPVKLGFTFDLPQRLRSYQQDPFRQAEYLAVSPLGFQLETRLKGEWERFRSDERRTEWFFLPTDFLYNKVLKDPTCGWTTDLASIAGLLRCSPADGTPPSGGGGGGGNKKRRTTAGPPTTRENKEEDVRERKDVCRPQVADDDDTHPCPAVVLQERRRRNDAEDKKAGPPQSSTTTSSITTSSSSSSSSSSSGNNEVTVTDRYYTPEMIRARLAHDPAQFCDELNLLSDDFAEQRTLLERLYAEYRTAYAASSAPAEQQQDGQSHEKKCTDRDRG